MPYIDTKRRSYFDGVRNTLADIQSPGELNYVITTIALDYLYERKDNPSYNDYNEIVGVLECAKLEFYRRAVATYENEKITQFGDVY